MERLPELLGPLGVEGGVSGMRLGRTLAEGLIEASLVELVDGVARRLVIATRLAGDPVSVLAIGAGEKCPRAARGEGVRRTQARLQGLALGVVEGTHED